MASRDAGPLLASLLVGTDFSSGASLAVERAARLPLARGARVHVFHVLPSRTPKKLRARSAAEAEERLAATASALAQRAGAASRPDLKISSGIAHGEAYVELIHEARRRRAGLIAIGRHGRSTLRDLLIGSTAERVVREGDVPVLVVNTKATRTYTRPLAAVELAEDPRPAQGIVDLAAALVDPSVDRLPLLHVFDVPLEGRVASALDREGLLDYRDQWKEKAARDLKRLQGKLVPTRLELEPVLRSGDARLAVVREAKRRRSDLLVVGTHGRSGIAHAILGSVAAWVMGSAASDVAIERPPGLRYEAP